MRILYITQTFHPETLGAERLTRQAIALRKLGHEVTVLTTMPYYPVGEVLAGYRGKFLMREKLEGLDVVRIWSMPSGNNAFLRRIFSYVSFAVLAALVGACLRRRDLVIAAVPHPGTELAGLVVSRLRRTSLLLEMVDVLPDNLPFIGIPLDGRMGRALGAYYRIAYRLADWIAVLCPSARDVIAEKGIDPGKIMLMPNGADADLLQSISPAQVRARHGIDGKFVVLYAGSFSRYYQVPNIIAAARLLKETHPAIHFMLLGQGPQWQQVRDEVETSELTNVTLAGSVPREELGGHLQAADVCIFSMVGNPTPRPYHGILTAKACDYLLAGRPIIAVEHGEIISELLTRIGAGCHVRPGDPQALADAIQAYAQSPQTARMCGQRAAEYAQLHLLREDVVAKFEKELRAKMEEHVIPDEEFEDATAEVT